MATYGLNSFGFLRPSLTEIVEQRKQAYRDLFGSNINTNDNSVIDKIVSIEADRENQVWMQMQEVYDSQTYQGVGGKYGVMWIVETTSTMTASSCGVLSAGLFLWSDI